MVIAAFACHGIWYEERANAYFERDELKRNDDITAEWVLFITELALLGLFAIDAVLHMIGFGKHYLRSVKSIPEILCIVANTVVVFFMMNSVFLS